MTFNFLMFAFYLSQENDGTKTNNGVHYRLQLLFANGKIINTESEET